jgi:Tfp pilus assembly protein PilF
MKKTLLLALAVLVVAAAVAAGARWLRPAPPQWSSESPAALAELEAGHEAIQQLYAAEAADHFWRALEHDPGFAIAKLRAVQAGNHPPERRERVNELVEELRATDLDALTPRERLLIGTFLARLDHDPDEVGRLLDAFLAEHPDDPYAVDLACMRAFAAGDLDRAESCYRRLIELDPNQVGAQNFLGYLLMARGDFAAAEEQFQVYRYVAPDQANPHDSLGELYLLTGRYEEAEREFEQAVAVKSDFCASRANLVLVELLRGDFAAAGERVAEVRRDGVCGEPTAGELACRVEAWRAAGEDRWGDVLAGGEGCPDAGDLLVLTAWAARREGRPEVAAKIAENLATYGGQNDPMLRPVLDHLAGAGLLDAGDPAGAAESFRAADRALLFRSQEWTLKLYNRLALAAALDAAGRPGEAAAVLAEVDRVNPRLRADGVLHLPRLGAAR